MGVRSTANDDGALLRESLAYGLEQSLAMVQRYAHLMTDQQAAAGRKPRQKRLDALRAGKAVRVAPWELSAALRRADQAGADEAERSVGDLLVQPDGSWGAA